MSFTQDLKAGVEVEEELVEFLKGFGLKAGRNQSSSVIESALYDVYDSDYRTYEVKYDRRAQETGNVFLEHKSLTRSHANYVVYKLDGDKKFYILDLHSVKNIIDDDQYEVKDGGSPAYPGTLLPLKEFKRLFRVFDEKILPKKTPSKKTR